MAFVEYALTLETDECVLFPYGRTGAGYANIRVGDRFEYGHVIVCQRARGPRPTPKHQAAHSCGNGHMGCINKRHLSWKTPEGNIADAVEHGTMSRGTKLTPEDVKSIRALAEVMRHRDIAKMFGVRGDTVSSVVRGKTWAHLTDDVANGNGADEAALSRQVRNQPSR